MAEKFHSEICALLRSLYIEVCNNSASMSLVQCATIVWLPDLHAKRTIQQCHKISMCWSIASSERHAVDSVYKIKQKIVCQRKIALWLVADIFVLFYDSEGFNMTCCCTCFLLLRVSSTFLDVDSMARC